ERPEPRMGVAYDNEAVGVAHVELERAIEDRVAPRLLGAAVSPLVGALAGVVPTDPPRVCRIADIDHLQTVFIGRGEHIGPADLVIVRKILEIGNPGPSGFRDRWHLS